MSQQDEPKQSEGSDYPGAPDPPPDDDAPVVYHWESARRPRHWGSWRKRLAWGAGMAAVFASLGSLFLTYQNNRAQFRQRLLERRTELVAFLWEIKEQGPEESEDLEPVPKYGERIRQDAVYELLEVLDELRERAFNPDEYGYQYWLKGVLLSDLDLVGMDLSESVLRGAYLSKARLPHANLSDADLSYANLSDADLSYADLSYANLSDADLTDALGLTKEQLLEAIVGLITVPPRDISPEDWAEVLEASRKRRAEKEAEDG